ncbi:MAG: hypothetical protein RL301_533 [Actinomycetota bacterium]|jgi:transaldolase
MKIADLYQAGTSAWLDDLSRGNIDNGHPNSLVNRVNRREIYGVTTNPAIFTAAITKDPSYRNDIETIRNLNAEEIIEQLTTDDVRRACQILKPIYSETNGVDGRVSIEVDPRFAHDATQTIDQAKRLWGMIDQENLMIKVPATKEGLVALTELISIGISVNVTLIFSIERYTEVIDAYIAGAKKCANPKKVHSVASFFISRLDTAIDPLLENETLKGKAAVANACLAYELFQKKFAGLENSLNLQRPLWASTGVKNPNYPDTKYIDELIAPNSVNTMPPATLDAFLDHGNPSANQIGQRIEESKLIIADLKASGINLKLVTDELERDGISKFIESWKALIELVRVQK